MHNIAQHLHVTDGLSSGSVMQLMKQVHADPNVPQLQVMRKQVSRILQRFTSKR